MAKNVKKSISKKVSKNNEHKEKWHDVMDNLNVIARSAKKKYDAVDPATKKKIAAAAVGALATLAVAFGLKKARKKK